MICENRAVTFPTPTEASLGSYTGEYLKQLAFICLSHGQDFNLNAIRNLLGSIEGGYTYGKLQKLC